MIRLNSDRWLTMAALALAGLLVTGCAASRGGPIAYDVQNFGVPDPVEVAVLPESYVVSSGDKLRITVFQVEDLSREYEVDLAGNISMPLIGSVRAMGQTTAQLRETISTRLGARYLRNPDVTVDVMESQNRTVTVDGSVQQPGVFPVHGPMSLMQAVALARGASQDANPRRVAVFRRVEGQRMAAAFDLVSIRRGENPDPEIYAGDIVVVDGNQARSMLREVFGALPILALFRPY